MRCRCYTLFQMTMAAMWAMKLQVRLLLLLMMTIIICNINAAATQTNIDAAGSNVSIENDVLHFSYELERWLDTQQQPCSNFYGFVCGRSLNGSEAQVSNQRLRQAQQQKFDQFLANENEEQMFDAELKLKQFYASCQEARSTEDLKSTLMYRTAGGWPAIDDAAVMIRKRRNMTWLDVLSAFHDAGFEYFFEMRVDIKSNKRVVQLQPDTSIRYTLRKFEQLVGEVLQEYAVDAGRARLVALEIMNFERNRREVATATATVGEQEFTYATFKSTLFGNTLQSEWDAYFKRTLGKTLKPTDVVLVRQMPKLQQYFQLLQNTTMTRLLNWLWIDYLMDKRITECQSLVQHYFEPVYQHIVERAIIDKVQMAQMFADIGSAYDELLLHSSWIDEMSQQQSKQFHGRVLHLTLNGDTKLDADFADLTITKRNFYRNLEKLQRHLRQQRKQEQEQQLNPSTQSHGVAQAASEFMKVLLTVGALVQQQNLTMPPLNYLLVGEHFAERMIASGSSSTTPGAWRSMDSEREFATLTQCLQRQQTQQRSQGMSNVVSANYNLNDLLLRILAQHQTLHALNAWQTKNTALWRRLDRLLSAGRLQLTLRKLYFVGALLTNCRHYGGTVERQFVHSYLRNSQEFTQTFGCHVGDELYARNVCKVL